MSHEARRIATPWSRRSALMGVGGAAALGLGKVNGMSPAAIQEASPTGMATHPIVGTWIVDRNPVDTTEMPTTNVFTADGGLIDPSVGAAGVWTATGPDTADFTLIVIVPEGGGSYFLVRSSITVDADGNTATAAGSQTHVAADGTVLEPIPPGLATYLRLHVEPPSAGGQPLAGFPAWEPSSSATPTT